MKIMFDNPKELLDKVRLGEIMFLEFKEVCFAGGKARGPNRDSLAGGLAAFVNSHGGVFVLGVEDKTHEVVGIPTDCLGIPTDCLDVVVDFVREMCIGSIDPPIDGINCGCPQSTEDELAVVKV